MTIDPTPRSSIAKLKPYNPEDAQVSGVDKIYNLSANENPLGASPKAYDAFLKTAQDMAVYPDGGAYLLREAIAHKYGLNIDQIVCGNGSDELLSLLAHTYLSEGDEGIYSEHGFLVYPITITAAGGVPVVAKEKRQTTDVDALLSCVSSKTKLVFLANPNNPTGTYLPFDEVKRLHAALPSHVLLVLDAAYAEYVKKNDYAAGVELVSSSHNVVMTRTFSKIYGLAGLRLGWLFAPPSIADMLNRARSPYNINGPAQAAGIAAIQDEVHVARSIQHNSFWVDFLIKELSGLGLFVPPSVGNFLLVHFPEDSSYNAESAETYLCSKGFILRRMSSYGFPNALRLSVGTEDANRNIVTVLKTFLSGHKDRA